MSRNSKENSMQRYEEMLRVSVRYLDYIKHPRFHITFSSITRKKLNEAAHYVVSVKKALNSLDKPYRELLMFEFFNETYNPLWWKKYYTKSTYYRRRSEAIRAFEEAFSL